MKETGFISIYRKFGMVLLSSYWALLSAIPMAVGAEEIDTEAYFAIVEGVKIPYDEYEYTVGQAVRDKYYHGKVAADEMRAFQKEVADKLIARYVLALSAEKEKIRVDGAVIEQVLQKKISGFEKKQNWDKLKLRLLPILRREVRQEELVKALAEKIKNVSLPEKDEVQDYYSSNKDKFTAPKQWGISLILLKVAPSAPSGQWAETTELANRLVAQLRNGEDFADLARIHSGDESAENGGDMGYQHIGMLAKPAQDVLNMMQVGDISEPVLLLQGAAIFRLNKVMEPKLNTIEKVQDRASQLLLRESRESAWGLYKEKAVAAAKIEKPSK